MFQACSVSQGAGGASYVKGQKVFSFSKEQHDVNQGKAWIASGTLFSKSFLKSAFVSHFELFCSAESDWKDFTPL